VPEPSTLAIAAAGCVAIASGVLRRRAPTANGRGIRLA
jgi:hypothetical protein